MRDLAALMFIGFLLAAGSAGADPIQIPLPLESPVSTDLNVDPVVTFGTRTIDFTPNLNQEFIAFLIAVTPVTTGFRNTIGARARDGLFQLSGSFPASGDTTFVNQLPTFSVGTTKNRIAFDLIIPGCCTPFSVSLLDINRDSHAAEFSPDPVPEPASGGYLGGTGLALLGSVRRRRDRPALTV